MTTIGILGAGAMHVRIVQHLLAAGHTIRVFNRTASRAQSLVEAGAILVETPASVCEGAELIFSMVRDDEASDAVWFGPNGAAAAIATDAVAIEASTISLEWSRELSEKMQKSGVVFAVSPVLGSLPQAENGELVYLLGGDAVARAKVQDICQPCAKLFVDVEQVAKATALKLVVNAHLATQVALWSETMDLFAEAGVVIQEAIDLLAPLPTSAPAVVGVMNLLAAGDFTSRFPVELATKDVGYAASAIKRRSPNLLNAVHKRYIAAVAEGLGQENLHAVHKV